MLYDIGVYEDVVILCDQLGWTKFFKMKHDTLYEFILEFYTTFKFMDDNKHMFLCRLFRNEFHMDCELMSYIFRFPMGVLTQPPREFEMLSFWRRITEDSSFSVREMMVSGLIKDHA